MQQTKLRLVPRNYKNRNSADHWQSASTESVLEELYRLLEDYAPSWYTEEQHLRVLAALEGHTA